MEYGERFFMKEAKERGRPTGVPASEVDVEAQPGAAEAERKERALELRRLISGNQLDDMRTLSSFEGHNRGRKFVVTCILVQRHEATSQKGVMNFHLCLSIPINSLWKAFDMKARSFRKVHGREQYARLGRRWLHDPQFDDHSEQHSHAKLHEERVNFQLRKKPNLHIVFNQRDVLGWNADPGNFLLTLLGVEWIHVW